MTGFLTAGFGLACFIGGMIWMLVIQKILDRGEQK